MLTVTCFLKSEQQFSWGGLIITFTISLPKEMFYLQRKYKIETEVENWIQKYDTDMGERQVRLIYIFFSLKRLTKRKVTG